MFSEDQRWLTVRTDHGQDMTFDVGGGHCEVTEDGDDTKACFMDYRKCVLHFKMNNEKKIQVCPP